MSNVPVLTFDVEGSLFSERAPKADKIKAVKLFEGNLRAVGAYIFKTLGARVEIIDDAFLLVGTREYRVGQWLVEYYDYVMNRVGFRLAGHAEREKYDLR